MFKRMLPILAVAVLSAGCKSTQTQTDMNENTLQEVAGRKNFGASHGTETASPLHQTNHKHESYRNRDSAVRN